MLGIGAQCPTGKLRMSAMRNLPVVLICRMATALPNTPNQLHVSACPVPTRGAYRDRHGRWVRDAMDASDAVDESAALRTAKLCGPDAPMLASSLRVNNPQATVAKEPGHRGERRISRRTIAQGRPDCFGEPVATTLVRFLFAREAAGASRTRLSLAPSYFRGATLDQPGRVAPRKCGVVSSWLFDIRILTSQRYLPILAVGEARFLQIEIALDPPPDLVGDLAV